jgi:hypothetical protein
MLAKVGVLGFFNTIAIATSHEHWLKEHTEVQEIIDPLTVWLNQLPAKRIKQLENNIAPILTIGGFLNVFVPDVAEEIKIRRESARTNAGQEKGKPGARGVNPVAGGAPNVGSQPGANGAVDPVRATIPNDFARSIIDDSFNV